MTGTADTEPHSEPRRSRRAVLAGLAGLAAAGATAALDADRADAANGDAIIIGSSSNTGSQPTGIAATGTAMPYGFGITDNGFSGDIQSPALFGHAKGTAFTTAIRAKGEGSATGVHTSAQYAHAVFAFGLDGVLATTRTQNVGGGPALMADVSGSSAAIVANQVGVIGGDGMQVEMTASSNTGSGLAVRHQGTGVGVDVNVTNASNPSAAIHVANAGAGAAVSATNTAASSTAPAIMGVATKGAGVRGQGKIGGVFSGTAAQVRLTKTAAATHPASGVAGDLYVDASARLWFCKGGAAWVNLA